MIEKGKIDLVVRTNEDIYEILYFTGDWTSATFTSKLKNPLTNVIVGSFTIPTPTYSSVTGKTTIIFSMSNTIVSTLDLQLYEYDILATSAIKKVYVYGEIEIQEGIS